MTEEWRPIPGYEAVYEVSDMGRVRNVRTGRFLRGCGKADKTVALCIMGVVKQRQVHTLVAECFIGPKPWSGALVCHTDDVPTNNVLSNLYYGSAKTNADDRTRHGQTKRGAAHPHATCTEEIARAIKADPVSASSDLAERYGVSTSVVRSIRSGRNWRHV